MQNRYACRLEAPLALLVKSQLNHQVPREDLERCVTRVNKSLRAVSQEILAQTLIYPSVDPHPQQYEYKDDLRLYKVDLEKTMLKRAQIIRVLKDPEEARRVRELCVTGRVPSVVWNEEHRHYRESTDVPARLSLQEVEIEELARVLPNAVNLRSLR